MNIALGIQLHRIPIGNNSENVISFTQCKRQLMKVPKDQSSFWHRNHYWEHETNPCEFYGVES